MNLLELNDGLISILALVSIGLALAILMHLVVKTKWLAIVLTAIFGAIAFHWLASEALGQREPFSPLAFVISMVILSAIAYLISKTFFRKTK